MTQAELKAALSYNPLTGRFIWLVPSNRRPIGSEAGFIDRLGYRYIGLRGKRWAAHRLAWLYETGALPTGVIDHINHNRADNSFANLRDVSHKDNIRNQLLNSRSTTGIRGVTFNKKHKRWRAHITVDGVYRHLGSFLNKDEATRAAEEARKKIFVVVPKST